MKWRIYGRRDGHDYGVYSGATPQEAILAMMVDAQYEGAVDWENWVVEPQYGSAVEERDGETGGVDDTSLAGERVVRLTALARAAGILPSEVAMWARKGLVPGAYRRHEGRGWWYIRLEDAVGQLARWWGISFMTPDLWRRLAERVEHGTDGVV